MTGKMFEHFPQALYVTDVIFQSALHPVGSILDCKRATVENIICMAIN